MSRARAAGAAAVCALGAAALGACASDSGGSAASPSTTTTTAASTMTVAARRAAPRPAARPVDLRGVAAADARRIRGYPGWTVQRGRPTGDLAALGSAHRGGVKRIVVNRSAARLAPGGRQRYPYPVGTTIVKTAGPVRTPTLIAIMYKVARGGARDGGWDYVEYLRGSASAALVRVGGGEAVCTGCHMAAERGQGTDWVFSTLR